MGLTSPLYLHGQTYMGLGSTRISLSLSICYFPPFGAKSYKSTNTYPYTLFHQVCFLLIVRGGLLVGGLMLDLILTKDKTSILTSMASTY